MKIMEDIALFAKYTGLRREVFNIEVNSTVFRNFFSDEDCSKKMSELDGLTSNLLTQLKNISDQHREAFTKFSNPMLDSEGDPTKHMRNMLFMMVVISGGEVPAVINYLNDLLTALKPRSNQDDRFNEISNFVKELLGEGYLSHVDSGTGNPMDFILQVTELGLAEIKDDLDDLERKKKEKTGASNEVFDLMSMTPPSSSIN